jgi:hypothetical protein
MSESENQKPSAEPPMLPSSSNADGATLAEDLGIAKRMKQKSRNEAHLTAGCGYNAKKELLLKAFWGEMWPELVNAGWQKVRDLKR